MDIGSCNSSLLPISWIYCSDIFNMLIRAYNRIYEYIDNNDNEDSMNYPFPENDEWYDDFCMAMYILISETTDKTRYKTIIEQLRIDNIIIPTWINKKIIDIVDDLFNDIYISIRDGKDIKDYDELIYDELFNIAITNHIEL